MRRFFRQFVFLVFTLVLQWPVLLVLSIIGRFGVLKTLFLIYPTDRDECLDFCPDIKILRKFYCSRPTPAGIITDGYRPIGVYMLVPNTAMELCKKKNKFMTDNIIRRMLFFKKLTGAQTIGLAGQLGPIMEKQTGEKLQAPFYTSTFGNIWSIYAAANHIVHKTNKKPWNTRVTIIGSGELAERVEEQFSKNHFNTEIIEVAYTRKLSIKIKDLEQAKLALSQTDLTINLLPRGIDFLSCNIQNMLPPESDIIDFSRPQLHPGDVPQNLHMGNRVQSGNIQFKLRLPGGWQRYEIPACSMPALIAAMIPEKRFSMDQFKAFAQQFGWTTALAGRNAGDSAGIASTIELPVT